MPAEVVFTVNLEPFNCRPLLEKLHMVLCAQPNPRALRFASSRSPVTHWGGETEHGIGGSAQIGGRDCQPLLARRETAIDQPFAGTLRDLEKIACASSLGTLPGTGVRGTGAIVLAGFGNSVAFLHIGFVR